MQRELLRFSVFLALAVALHLVAAWGWGWLPGGKYEEMHLPRLDLSSVELTLSSDEATVEMATSAAIPKSAPSALIKPEPPPPEVESAERIDNPQPVFATDPPPPTGDFTAAELLPPSPPEPRVKADSEVPKTAKAVSESPMTAKVEVPPAPKAEFRPKYPESCRRRGEEGIVTLDIDVDVFGHAAEVSVAVSSGFAKLDAAAVNAVRMARFTPASSDGKPVSGRIRIPVSFRLTP